MLCQHKSLKMGKIYKGVTNCYSQPDFGHLKDRYPCFYLCYLHPGRISLQRSMMALSPYLSNLHHLESLLPYSSSSSLLTSSSSGSLPRTVTTSWRSEARSASSGSSSCPPQTGFNAFAFLAFILIAIDTIMNINNNINNNNNNNNNNDRNNNNNNNFEAMNMNVRRSFKEDNLCPEVMQSLFYNAWLQTIFKTIELTERISGCSC